MPDLCLSIADWIPGFVNTEVQLRELVPAYVAYCRATGGVQFSGVHGEGDECDDSDHGRVLGSVGSQCADGDALRLEGDGRCRVSLGKADFVGSSAFVGAADARVDRRSNVGEVLGCSDSGVRREGVSGVGVCQRLDTSSGRGPNYERNRASRLRRKAARDVQRGSDAAGKPVGFYDGCSENVRSQLVETRAELTILRNKRQIIEERRKLEKYQSPMQMLEDAMHMVKKAQDCAKTANDNKVSAWAESLSQAYAESIAKSASASTGSIAAGTYPVGPASVVKGKPKVQTVIPLANRTESGVDSRYTFQTMPMTRAEEIANRFCMVTDRQIIQTRMQNGRALFEGDFRGSPRGITLSPALLIVFETEARKEGILPGQGSRRPEPVKKGWWS